MIRSRNVRARAAEVTAVGVLAAVLGVPACEERFQSCEASRTCPIGGEGGASGGSAGDGGMAGSLANGGESGADTGGPDAGGPSDPGGAGGDAGAPAEIEDGGAAGSERGGSAGEAVGGAPIAAGAGGSGGAADSDPCDPNPCGNEGKCVTVSEETFKCECVPPSSGDLCEELPDPCDPDPCENGTCIPLEGDYECECSTDNRFGKNCEHEHFRGLSYPLANHNYGRATGVSADGEVVVGWSAGSEYEQAFRWTRSEGFSQLGTLEGGSGSAAWGVSGDGLVVVGSVQVPHDDGGIAYVGFQWTAADGMLSLPHSAMEAEVNAADFDGTVAVGFDDRADLAMFWRNGAAEGFSFEDGGEPQLTDVSDDGSLAVGWDDLRGPFRRRLESATTTWLDYLLPDHVRGAALGVSGDGSVTVGYSSTQSFVGSSAVRWLNENSEPEDLGTFGGGSRALATNVDGSVIVGYSAPEGIDPIFPFVWTEADGMLNLEEILAELGVDLTGWALEYPTGVSADGKVIVGYGNHGENVEPWIARLP